MQKNQKKSIGHTTAYKCGLVNTAQRSSDLILQSNIQLKYTLEKLDHILENVGCKYSHQQMLLFMHSRHLTTVK